MFKINHPETRQLTHLTLLRSRHEKWLLILSACNFSLVLGGLAFSGVGKLSEAGVFFANGPLVFRSKTSMGILEQGQRYKVRVPVTNVSRRPIKIIGAQTSCTCTTLTGLPLSLQPQEKQVLEIGVSTFGKNGALTARVELFTDDPTKQNIALQLAGTVVAPVNNEADPR